MQTLTEKIGANLRAARGPLSIRRCCAELGPEIGVKPVSLRVSWSRWETGKMAMSIASLLSVARFLKVSVTSLLPEEK